MGPGLPDTGKQNHRSLLLSPYLCAFERINCSFGLAQEAAMLKCQQHVFELVWGQSTPVCTLYWLATATARSCHIPAEIWVDVWKPAMPWLSMVCCLCRISSRSWVLPWQNTWCWSWHKKGTRTLHWWQGPWIWSVLAMCPYSGTPACLLQIVIESRYIILQKFCAHLCGCYAWADH